MTNKKIKIIFILPLLIICLLSGCGNNQFDNDYRNFRDSYLKITDVLDSKEPFTSIEKLSKDPILNELDEMKSIVSKMSKEATSKSKKRIYDNVSKYYDGLEYLQYAAKNKENLSEDERGRIATELTLIEMNRSSIKRGKI